MNIFRLKLHLVVVLASASMLFACSGGGGSSSNSGSGTEVVVNPGSPPTANAGVTMTYNGGETAMLDGTGSTDPDGDPLRYTWLQTTGTNTVQLSDIHAARPVFEAPNANDTLTFSLVVNDGYSNSTPSTVTINTVVYTGSSAAPVSGNPFRGNYSFSGAGEDMVISGNYIYLPAGINRLRVVDITDPANLTQVAATVYPNPYAFDATLIGNFIYHTDYDATFHDAYVYATDVTNPSTPTLVGLAATFSSPSSARLTSEGNILYVAGGDSTTVPSLRVYEVTNTASPIGNVNFEISQPLPAPAEDVEVSGNYAYVADGASGLRIIDISLATAVTPTIKEVGSYDTAGNAVNVAVSGSYAYVADGMNGLVILNVSTPASPSLVATIPAPAGSSYGATSVDVSGDGKTLYYSNDFDVWVYDVTTPVSPVALGCYRAGNLVRKVRVSGSYIYVTDSQGLRTIPAAKVSMPRGAALYTAPDSIREMQVYGDLGFVRMYHQLDILDMRNPAAPALLASYKPQTDYIWGMAIVDNFAYLTQGTDKLNLLRFRNPAAPDVAKTIGLGTNANPYYIVTNGSYAYVYRNEYSVSKVEIFDVTNPYSPVAHGSLASPYGSSNWLRQIAVKGNRLYMTELNTSGTFRVADVSNPDAPALLGSGLANVDLYGLAFRNDYVVSIGNNTGVKVLDVSNPGVPVFYGTGYAQAGYSISVAASRAYTNSDFVGGGVKVLDMADPAAPSLAGELAPSGGADYPVVAGKWLYSFFNNRELHRNEREPMLASRYVTGSAGSTLTYSVGWIDEANGQDHEVKCWVTDGTCTVGTIDQVNNTAPVTWTLPVSTGDNEIVIAVGNGHYYGTTKDRVKVQ